MRICNDSFLTSQMDDQGWVLISIIDDFNRVKRMNTDITFILDALQSSAAGEVRGDKLRSRDNWAKYVASTVKPAVQKLNDNTTSTPTDDVNDELNVAATVCSSSCENFVSPVSRDEDNLEAQNNNYNKVSSSGHNATYDADTQAPVDEHGDSHEKLTVRTNYSLIIMMK